VGSTIRASGTCSTRTSPGPYITVARIAAPRSCSGRSCRALWRAAVVVVAHLLHPLDRLAVELLLDGDVSHRGRRRRAVPVLLAARDPDHVARTDLLD